MGAFLLPKPTAEKPLVIIPCQKKPLRSPPEPPQHQTKNAAEPEPEPDREQNRRQFIIFNFQKFFSKVGGFLRNVCIIGARNATQQAKRTGQPTHPDTGQGTPPSPPTQTGRRQSHRKPHPPKRRKYHPASRATATAMTRGERKPPMLTRWGEVLDRGLAMGLTSLGMP